MKRWSVPCLALGPLLGAGTTLAQDPEGEVPVTIRELDVAEAIQEFKAFQRRLGRFQVEIGEGRAIAQETAQMLAELRAEASPDNGYNEGPILEAVGGYVDRVLGQQVALVDFLESQRYRISYYAGKMASSVAPEDLAILFGTVEQNDAAIRTSVQGLDAAESAVADFVDGLPEGWFDAIRFRPAAAMPRETRRKLDTLLYAYQQERNGLELAKKRLQLVRAAQRRGRGPQGEELEIDSDLIVGQMFGTLDRIRLQMSMDLLFLEQLLTGYARSSRTHDILEAFQDLIELQGDLEGPSPELSSVLDWLQDSSLRRLTLGAARMARPGLSIPRYSELLREAYEGARGSTQD